MKPIVFIDGQEGTTGLQIHQRLGSREDIALLTIDPALRKDASERKRLLNAADLVFLCLPDAAARESVSLIENPTTKVIDASTAHRTDPSWVYGLPELSTGHREAIQGAMRVANPGCHATGFIVGVYPLVAEGILPKDTYVPCYSLTGYSGGGKSMIAAYESADRPEAYSSPRIYGLPQKHKHLTEMIHVTGLRYPPVFSPVVADYYKGMATTLLLGRHMLKWGPGARGVHTFFERYYKGEPLISVAPFMDTEPFPDGTIAANALQGSNKLQLVICGTDDQITITALFDNLGKGASGAAVQNMNLMLGLEETAGL